jgi:hypothetical protein
MSKEELILPVTEEEITALIASINKRKSADFHNSTIEHILHAGENIITVLTHIFCFSSVNILYASSTGRAAFMGDDPFVNPLCVGFCILMREFRTKRGLLLRAYTTMRKAA